MYRMHFHLGCLLFATLAAALPTPAHAAGPAGNRAGVEVCEVPLRYGVEATAAAIVRTACQEHRLWLRPFIEADGRLAALSVTEAERARLDDGTTPAWQQVARYWRESGTLSSMTASGTPGAGSCLYSDGSRAMDSDCRAFLVDNPWSAAFISWVMVRAPLPGFGASARHLDYIARAWRDPSGSPYLYADPFSAKAVPGDMLCFLRASDHGIGVEGLRAALSGQGRMPTRSHCEIVIAANVGGDRTLYLIGGNVLNAVMMRKLPLDRSGRLSPAVMGYGPGAPAGVPPPASSSSPARGEAPSTAAATPAGIDNGSTRAGHAPAVADPGDTLTDDASTPVDSEACRPGFPAACSFNRRDWAVLLKLKPQAQLGGYHPPISQPQPGSPASVAPAIPADQ